MTDDDVTRPEKSLLRAHRRKPPHKPDPHDPECVAFARWSWARYRRSRR